MQITIDAEFNRLIPALLPEEFQQLEANILRDGCQEPLSIWKMDGQNILLDGHNRYAICEKHGKRFEVAEVELASRDYALLWIAERQMGRRNLKDDQRAAIASKIRKLRARISRAGQAQEVGKMGGRPKKTHAAHGAANPQPKRRKSRPPSHKSGVRGKRKDTRKQVAKEFDVSEKKLRKMQTIERNAPELVEKVESGELSLADALKLARLDATARQLTIKAVEAGADVRAALRAVKKQDYNAKIAEAHPRVLEGTYRIIYADPPWKYIGLNRADEYGHAERHYDCLDDEQLKNYKIGGKRLVGDMTDKNAVLFLWVTSPLLERCFSIIKAWGFEYKSSFVWDKVKHNMGHYNSVRHELLLIATKGSCKPDVPKLVDSVQSIERTSKHSEKPEEFRRIIESLYDHGRKLELFHRGDAPAGWDMEGNETK